MDRAVIVGAGKTTRGLIQYMRELGYEFCDCFELCLDNDKSLWGTKLSGVVINPAEKLQDYPKAEIVISSKYEEDIREQLRDMNVNEYRIINYIDYMRKLMVEHQISRYNRTHPINLEKKTTDIKELTVYTVIINGYDFLHEVVNTDKNIRYVCFTDDKSLKSDTWEVRYVEREFDDPVIESRKYKMLPHLFIDTEFSLYIDANIQFNKSPFEFMQKYFNRGDLLFFPHPDRDCIYREMAVCILGNRDLSQRLIEQVSIYNKWGCPEHSGLYYGGIIGRRHREKEAIIFDEEWWEHFKKYSRRDQISLGHLIWKNGTEISLADIDIYNNSWVTIDSTHKQK